MSKLKDYTVQDNAIKTASNMAITMEAVETQLVSDASIIEDLEPMQAIDMTPDELMGLANAKVRTVKNNERKALYKAEFPKLKAKIKDTEIKDDIQNEIDKLKYGR